CFMDLLAEHDAELRWVSVGGNDRPGPRRKLLSHPEIHPGFTDAGAHVRNLSFQDGPLALLREAVMSGFMTPERAIARCTGEVAIGGRAAWSNGRAEPALGREALGVVLRPERSSVVEARRLRNRIDDRTLDHPFTRYWDVFVLKHQDSRNVALHCLGVVVFY